MKVNVPVEDCPVDTPAFATGSHCLRSRKLFLHLLLCLLEQKDTSMGFPPPQFFSSGNLDVCVHRSLGGQMNRLLWRHQY